MGGDYRKKIKMKGKTWKRELAEKREIEKNKSDCIWKELIEEGQKWKTADNPWKKKGKCFCF